VDETYIKVKGVWKYLYRAVNKHGKTVDFLLTAKRDKAAAKRFFGKATGANGDPNKVAMDKMLSTPAATYRSLCARLITSTTLSSRTIVLSSA
jgi:putative transposase